MLAVLTSAETGGHGERVRVIVKNAWPFAGPPTRLPRAGRGGAIAGAAAPRATEGTSRSGGHLSSCTHLSLRCFLLSLESGLFTVKSVSTEVLMKFRIGRYR